jgi:hypothetical protein
MNASEEAIEYLSGFKWCREIYSHEIYFDMGDILSIFLFEIDNSQSKEDNKIWIIVGDLPSMYLDTYGASSTKEVLMNYVELSSAWINAILKNQSIEDCFPFEAESTKENAFLLESRIEFIRDSILVNIEDVELRS